MDLDTRARQASQSLRDAVETSTPDDVVVPLRRRLPPYRAVVAVAATLALVFGTVAVTRAGDDDPRAVVAGEGDGEGDTVVRPVPMMVADPVPDGLEISEVIETGDRPGTAPGIDYTLFGDPDADRPFTGGDLGVLVFTTPAGDDLGPSRGPEMLDVSAVETDGRDRSMLAWVTDDGRRVEVSSSSMTDDELLLAARALDPVEPGSTPAGPLPGDLRPVISSSRAGDVVATVYSGGAIGLDVVAYRSDPGLLTLLEWESGAPATEVEVGSRPGILLRGLIESDGSSVLWAQDGDLVVAVHGRGLAEADLLAVADGVRPATAAERKAVPDRPGSTGPSGAGDLVAIGRVGEIEWRLTVAPTIGEPAAPTVCLEVMTSSSCTGYSETLSDAPDDTPPWEPLDEVSRSSVPEGPDGHTIFWGRAGADVARVRIEIAGRPPAEVEVVAAAGFDDRFYAVDIGTDSGEATVVALDGSGGELARRTETVYPPSGG